MYALRGNPLPNPQHQTIYVQSDSAPVNLQVFPTHYGLTPEVVDPVIKEEYQKFMNKLKADEEIYVEMNLRQTPVICMSRLLSIEPNALCPASVACDRCAINNRINKARFKLRVRFMTKKLGENAGTLQNLRNFIKGAEEKLLRKGRTQAELDELRRIMGVDNDRVENLPEINRQYFRAAEKEFIP